MILQRMASAIKRQDWSQVTIEIFIVVIGIFIGLQVDDWNNQRLDNQDERIFLSRLHEELLNTTNVRTFIRDQRFADWEILSELLFPLYEDTELESLTDRDCLAIVRSSILTANVGELPSFTALLATGRINIIRDEALKTALVRFEQQRELLAHYVDITPIDLGRKYPELFDLSPQVDENGNVEAKASCDLSALRANQGFLNDLVLNIDVYESYITSGLTPVAESIDPLHQLLDENLGITHEVETPRLNSD